MTHKEKTMNCNTFIISIAAMSLSACTVTPQTEATPVNMVEVRDGKIARVDMQGPNTIVCQDYWQQFTLWDRAVVAPEGMSRADADGICRSREQMATEAPTAQPWEPVFNSRSNAHDPFMAYVVDVQPSAPGDVIAR